MQHILILVKARFRKEAVLRKSSQHRRLQGSNIHANVIFDEQVPQLLIC